MRNENLEKKEGNLISGDPTSNFQCLACLDSSATRSTSSEVCGNELPVTTTSPIEIFPTKPGYLKEGGKKQPDTPVFVDNLNFQAWSYHARGPIHKTRTFDSIIPVDGVLSSSKITEFRTDNKIGRLEFGNRRSKAVSTNGTLLTCLELNLPYPDTNELTEEMLTYLSQSDQEAYSRQLSVYRHKVLSRVESALALSGGRSGSNIRYRVYQVEFYVRFPVPLDEEEFFHSKLVSLSKRFGTPFFKGFLEAKWAVETPKTAGATKRKGEKSLLKFYRKGRSFRLELRYENPKIGDHCSAESFEGELLKLGERAANSLREVVGGLQLVAPELDISLLKERIERVTSRAKVDRRYSFLVSQLEVFGQYSPSEVPKKEDRLTGYQLAQLCECSPPILVKKKRLNSLGEATRKNLFVLGPNWQEPPIQLTTPAEEEPTTVQELGPNQEWQLSWLSALWVLVLGRISRFWGLLRAGSTSKTPTKFSYFALYRDAACSRVPRPPQDGRQAQNGQYAQFQQRRVGPGS